MWASPDVLQGGGACGAPEARRRRLIRQQQQQPQQQQQQEMEQHQSDAGQDPEAAAAGPSAAEAACCDTLLHNTRVYLQGEARHHTSDSCNTRRCRLDGEDSLRGSSATWHYGLLWQG